jgi:hypothetical protein
VVQNTLVRGNTKTSGGKLSAENEGDGVNSFARLLLSAARAGGVGDTRGAMRDGGLRG